MHCALKMGKKLMEEEKRVNEEEADRLLKESHEPDYTKRPDEEELLALEKQKRELVESKHRICTLELELQDAQRKMHEIEMNSASLETKYQMFLFHQAEEYKNLRSAQHGAKEEVVRMQMEWKCQLSSLEKELQAMARAASGYHKVLAENRALYNEVQDLKGVSTCQDLVQGVLRLVSIQTFHTNLQDNMSVRIALL
jgi:kinesin family protein C2/C3